MELDWSKQSPHIRSLYHPWQLGDGYEENIIQAAETQLGHCLPAPLRNFYAAWGRRKDLTILNQALVGPDELVMRSDALIFCFENQAVCAWAIRHEDLEEANPPIVAAYALSDWEWWEVDAPLIWMPSYAHVSDFLDTLTYHHALCVRVITCEGSSDSFSSHSATTHNTSNNLKQVTNHYYFAKRNGIFYPKHLP